ncbi:plastocyanin/azurin family copper-binding protein [Terrabacter lapilli]|uniref:Plastocyanin/azurin family copper-binding protein n=1 Tax=Terrabacter lapilli TaxID=436231 RepID=A0ABN2RPH0_9MICO
MATARCSILTRRRLPLMTGIAACSLLLAACSGTAQQTAPPGDASAAASSTGPAAPGEVGTATQNPGAAPAATAGTITLEVGSATGAKEFHYDKTTITEPAGHKIKLKFVNHTDPKDEVGHNWVLVKAGQEAAVVASGQAAGDDKDWLNVDDPHIVAHTQLIEGNQSNTVTFTAAPGTYTYLCTFPGHYAAGEKGTLVIK